jgi:hypothetical protein
VVSPCVGRYQPNSSGRINVSPMDRRAVYRLSRLPQSGSTHGTLIRIDAVTAF